MVRFIFGFGPFVETKDEIIKNLGAALLLFGVGFALFGLRRKSEPARVGGRWYWMLGLMTVSLSILLAGPYLLYDRPVNWILLPGMGLGFLATLFRLSRSKEDRDFQPRPDVVLGLKAFLCIVVSLQLVYPVMARWQWPEWLGQMPAWSASFASLGHHADSLYRASCKPWSADTFLSAQIFPSRGIELLWVLLLFVCLLALYLLEYVWVVRPYAEERQDPVIDPHFGEDSLHWSRVELRSLARLTLPWLIYDLWLPVIRIEVNLGFDRLDHRRVIQAMLTGLRSQYRRAFLAWNSGLGNLGRLLRLVALLMIVVWAGESWFGLPEELDGSAASAVELEIKDWDHYSDICNLFADRQMGVGIANLVCKLPYGTKIFHVLYYDLIGTSVKKLNHSPDDHLLFYILPFSQKQWPPEAWLNSPGLAKQGAVLIPQGIHFRVYHLLLLITAAFLWRWVLKDLPFPPYKSVLRRIEEVLDSLTSSTSVTSRVGRLQPVQWLEGLFLNERVRQVQQDPFDPRTIEYTFLRILEEIQQARIVLPGARNQLFSLPVPEMIFVFDELDKVGTRGPIPGEVEAIGNQPEKPGNENPERRRSVELHRLFADLKNLMSTAPARFLFVGGRNLHDEWLADQASRQSLLSFIFQAEIYLPALLTDHSRRDHGRQYDQRIKAYLKAQIDRANDLHRALQRKRFLPSLGLPLENPCPEVFISEKPVEGNILDIIDTRAERSNLPFEVFGASDLERDFIQFLTYRSLGNPKRLKELIAVQIRPLGRIVEKALHSRYNCEHILCFYEVDRNRIQLVASVYRHLADRWESSFVSRDDKITITMFNLSDFLLKFHRRAFSWSTLERVEDLSHIHRAPDLRELLESIVDIFADRYLHRILNGMYDFRFRSSFALELQHLSRQSAEEMAALNFTLDESQGLKAAYESSIDRLKDGHGPELQELVTGLGELHEFDQEYEAARFYYRWGITLLDRELREVTGGSAFLEEASPMLQVMAGSEIGEENARIFLRWGISRLRLMLQTGMTFELTRNFERAEAEYQDARTLARALLLAYLGTKQDQETVFDPNTRMPVRHRHRLHAIKHLNLLFQPVFAEAWLAEKMGVGIDTSVFLLEGDLADLRKLLPFVREPSPEANPEQLKIPMHASFSLIMAELHNKAGDLLFFKGRQVILGQFKNILNEAAARAITAPVGDRREGYLLRAHHHYAVSLHELRRFTTWRKRSSPSLLNIATQDNSRKTWQTLWEGGWPDFVYRTAGETFNDMAEAIIGRVSLIGLHGHLGNPQLGDIRKTRESEEEDLLDACTRWLESEKRAPEVEIRIPLEEDRSLNAGALKGWLGEWDSEGAAQVSGLSSASPIRFSEWERHGDPARLGVGLELMKVGASYLKRGGYIEDSAQQYMNIAEIAATFLWWRRLLPHALSGIDGRHRGFDWYESASECRKLCMSPRVQSRRYWKYLLDTGINSLQKISHLLKDGHIAKVHPTLGSTAPADDKVPVFAVTLACSLGLVVVDDGALWEEEINSLLNLLGYWYVSDPGAGIKRKPRARLRNYLQGSLLKNTFPVMNRLAGLKVLIDATVLGDTLKRRMLRVVTWTEELLDLAEKVNAPLQFTPIQTGTTCALVYLTYRDRIEKHPELRGSLDRIRVTSRRHLLHSEQMSTMRRSFYESVSNLYYLYDDFNDRHLHFHHAMQMAGIELATLLRAMVKDLEPGNPG